MKRSLIILLIIFCLGCVREKFLNDLNFDSQIWKGTNLGTKGRMAPNLVESNLLVGRTKSEVENLLGKCDYQIKSTIYYQVDVGEGRNYDVSVFIDEVSGKVTSTTLGD